MRIIDAEVDFCQVDKDSLYKAIERAGRTCYKSEDKITDESAKRFVAGIVKRGHEAMLEHASVTAKFIVDRGVSHEIVRHRMASYAQESTRYCNYAKEQFNGEITVIKPLFFADGTRAYETWKSCCEEAEKAYFDLLEIGFLPEEARTVLPTSLKTEIIVTMNLREWRHFLRLRAAGTTGKPHPQMREVAMKALSFMREEMPEVFGDIYEFAKENGYAKA